jgi:meckelin
VQYIAIRILYWRYVSNPVSSFVDLAFLSNISVILMDTRHSGYYIHGRNAAQHSDTDLK